MIRFVEVFLLSEGTGEDGYEMRTRGVFLNKRTAEKAMAELQEADKTAEFSIQVWVVGEVI